MKNKQLTYIGIDPGVSGAIAVLWDGSLTLFDMPVVSSGTRRVFDINEIRGILKDYNSSPNNPVHVFVEELIPFKGGKLQCFSMGYGLGLLHATIQALGIPMTRKRPQEWKKEFQLIGKGKDASRMRAQELFPAYASEFAKKSGEGKAEAALMAEFLRRKHA